MCAVMLFNYKNYVLCCAKLHFLTLAVLVSALLAGMKFCESYVVATVGLYM